MSKDGANVTQKATVPTKPALWRSITKKARETSEGSKKGRWSARKAVLAQVSYKKRGGGWTTKDKAPLKQ
jgi:hypothetical protein